MFVQSRYAYLAKEDTSVKARFFRKGLAIASTVATWCMLVQPVAGQLTGTGVAYAEETAAKTADQQKSASAHSSSQQFVSPESSEGLLSTTEQMIEKLVLQIEQSRENREESKAAKEQNKDSKSSLLASLPSIKPITGFITSGFGMRVHPIRKQERFHTGTDFSAPVGTRVMATADGTVSFSGFDGGYGKKVVIDHGYGYKTVYAHLSKAVVRHGQRVYRGDVIAFSGNTGLSTGPHLHYEVLKDNVKVNPTAFFDEMPEDKHMTHHLFGQDINNSNS